MTLTIGCTTRPLAELEFSQACRHLADAGYTDVALFFDAGINADTPADHTLAVRRIADDAGLNPSMLIAKADLEAGIDEAVRRYRRVIDHASSLGARWLLDMGTGVPEYYQPYYELMRRVAPYAESCGVGISLKPHGGLTLTAKDLMQAHREVGHPAFGISFDPGNIIYYTKGAERPETYVAEVAPVVTTAMIKDCIVRDGQPDVLITPGEGWVDFHAVISGLCRGGFAGPLYVECVGGTEVNQIVDNLRATRLFVADIIAAVGDES